jgi:hypothetical protein
MDELSQGLPADAGRAWRRLDSPWAIQCFLDGIPYSSESIYRCPRRVLADRRAHCVDGALLAAAGLRRLGQRPRVVWIHAVNDDGHMIAVYRRGRWWGGVAKSNVVGLRFREPVYASLRELMMSYFNDYWNTKGERTMRGYTRPLDLSRFDRLRWETEDEGLPAIVDDGLDAMAIVPVLPRGVKLNPMDRRSVEAGLLGSDAAGLFRPE